MVTKYNNVEVSYPNDMSREEAQEYLKEELAKKVKYKLLRLCIFFNDRKKETLIIRPEYDTINRVRRITGYLSNVKNFNNAKQAEASDRIAHYITAWPSED